MAKYLRSRIQSPFITIGSPLTFEQADDSLIDLYNDIQTRLSKTGDTLSGTLNEAPPVTLASASTVNIGAANANTINLTGTTTITAFDSIPAGALRRIIFSGSLVLTYNATSLILPTLGNLTTAPGDHALFLSLGSGNWKCIQFLRASGRALMSTHCLPIAAGDETTALTTGTAKVTLRQPYGLTFNVTSVKLSSTIAPTGSALIVDVKSGGTSIFSTKPQIDSGATTSKTSGTPAVITTSTIADDSVITIDITQVGSSVAGAGLKVYLVGFLI